MKKTIYQHISEAYPIGAPTLDQVTEVVREHAPNISAPDQSFEQTVSLIHKNYLYLISWK